MIGYARFVPRRYAMAAALRAGVSTFRMVVPAVLLAVFLPPFQRVGETVYGVVARNRRRTGGGAACKIN